MQHDATLCIPQRRITRNTWRVASHVLMAIALFAAISTNGVTDEPGEPIRLANPKNPLMTADAPSILSCLIEPARASTWVPSTTDENVRDLAVIDIYKQVAPATVLVRYSLLDSFGHGTGFVVDPNGWIVTNHHVIADALPDARTGARRLAIYLGDYDDGEMKLNDREHVGLVYSTNRDKDLALIKLVDLPTSSNSIPTISLASQKPSPGMGCVVVGHPTAGALWSVRSGEVAAIVAWPRDATQTVVRRFVACRARPGTLREDLAKRSAAKNDSQ